MAEDSPNDGLTYYLQVPEVFLEDLNELRSLTNLKMAYLGETIWLTGFTQEQAKSILVASLPHKKLYIQKGKFLHFTGKQLPEREVPTGLLWTPIVRAIKLQTASAGSNYQNKLNSLAIRLQEVSDVPVPPKAVMMRVTMLALSQYLETAPRIRYEHLQWCLLDDKEALIYGEPMLPIPTDQVYWQKNASFLPLGFDFELKLMADVVQANQQSEDDWLLWERDNAYTRLSKSIFRPLTLSSLRSTITKPEVLP